MFQQKSTQIMEIAFILKRFLNKNFLFFLIF